MNRSRHEMHEMHVKCEERGAYEKPRTPPTLWQEARRRMVLGAAGACAPGLLALLEWWLRR